MDMVSELIKELREQAEYWKADGHEPRNLLNKAADTIEKLSDNSGGWIPCSERLPERNKPVLIYAESATISSGAIMKVGACDNGFWFVQNSVDTLGFPGFPCNEYDVIAWQPLPEPFKSKSID